VSRGREESLRGEVDMHDPWSRKRRENDSGFAFMTHESSNALLESFADTYIVGV